ncbi:MAG: hypothetical protein K0M49_06980 [Arenimonas sp.]|nr:hypothetical protein [Arenimonas sp.]
MTDLVVIHSRDPDFSLLMGHILAGAGYEPLIAEHAEALGASEISRTLAIIIDCTGIAQDTLAFCKAIRQASVSALPPLIAMVPAQQAQDVLQLLSSGIDQVFMRPVSPEHLLMCLRAIREGGTALTDVKTRSVPWIRRFGKVLPPPHETVASASRNLWRLPERWNSWRNFPCRSWLVRHGYPSRKGADRSDRLGALSA